MTRSRWKPNFFIVPIFKNSFPDISSIPSDSKSLRRQKILLDLKMKSFTFTTGPFSSCIEVTPSHFGYTFGSFVFTRNRKR